MVIPISEASLGYAREVRAVLRQAHLFVDIDSADAKMQKKVREAQLAQYNYILVRAPLIHEPLLALRMLHISTGRRWFKAPEGQSPCST